MSEKKNETLRIGGVDIAPGTKELITLQVGKLPSGNIMKINAVIYRGVEDGPRVLLLAGIHGDEINGIEVLRRVLADELLSNVKKGMVIVIPLLNVFGFINFSRDVPDGKDVNRSFPGLKTGSLASRVAFTLTHEILPHVDYAIDLHTGGASRYNYPQIRYSKKDTAALELAQVFRAKFIIQKSYIPDSFRKVANGMGISVLVYEGGEAIRFNQFCIDSAYNGIERVLHHLGLVPSSKSSDINSIHVVSTGWVRASDSGLFLWSVPSGHKVEKGDVIGQIVSPYGDRTRQVKARRGGYIIGHNNASVVSIGDALFNIAYDGDEA